MAEGKYFCIRSQMHGKVLDIEGGDADPAAGTKCIMWDQKSTGENINQLFFECPLTGTIRAKMKPEFCLDVDDSNDCNLVIMPITYGDREQAWDLTDSMLVNRLTNKSLDISGANQDDGAECLAWDPHGEVNQRWDFVFQPAEYFYIVSDMNGKCLDVAGADPSPGTKVVTWPRKDEVEDNQLYYEDKKGFIRCKLNDYILDTDGDELKLNPYEPGKESQCYALDKNLGAIVNCNNRGQVLDIYAENDDDGATVGKWDWKEQSNQKWSFQYI